MLDTVTIATFSPLIGSIFAAQHGDHHDDFILVSAEVSKHAANRPDGMRECFSLLFKTSTAGHALAQGTYELVNPTLGALSVFLVPVAENSDGTLTLQAVFN